MKDLLQKQQGEKLIPDSILASVGMTHDLGKAHPLFQDYINNKGEGINHAFPSAWFTLNYARCFAENEKTPLIWMVESVRRHHTHMENADTSFAIWQNYKPKDFIAQKDKINKLVPNWQGFMTPENWEDFADSLILNAYNLVNENTWFFYRLLYSLLITADRMDAIGVTVSNEIFLPDFKPCDFSKKITPVDDWRESIHTKCLASMEDINEPGLFTLTLPTGSGKTFTGLDISYRMAKKWDKKNIIYAMPFISIIEQNAYVAREIFREENVQEDHSSSYAELKEINLKEPWSRMKNLFRYWQSPVILTTMVQLWEAIYSPRANDSMDFHRLANAVVIMDEPQTINPRLWQGFGKTLEFLSEKMGTTFILMTATQPRMIEGREIAPEKVEFPYNRHTYKILPGKYQIENISNLLEENIQQYREGSGLIVLNTRKSALWVYENLKDELPGKVLFLSTWMAPRHRRKIMAYLQYLEKMEIKHYLISTQAVEAGVDLDFDWVFRDMGPMDSIVQVAGRCNRHSARNRTGEVIVADLTNDKGKSFCKMVYDDILIDSSRTALQKKDSIHIFVENDVKNMVNNYYLEISERLTSEPVWDNIRIGKWGPEDKYKLIKEDNYQYAEKVYVEYERKLRPILEKLACTKWGLGNLEEKKILNRKASQYIIEIPLKELRAWQIRLSNKSCHEEIPPVGYVEKYKSWFITKEGLSELYDKISGFMPSDMIDENEYENGFL